MKRTESYKLFPLLPAAAGAVCLILRLGLYTMENENSLLPHSHPLFIATVLLAAATALGVGWFVLRMEGPGGYAENFPKNRLAGPGALAAGLCLFHTAVSIWQNAQTTLDWIHLALCAAAGGCLLYSGLVLLKGKLPSFPTYAVICVFFVLDMICRYQGWSGNPQVEDYIFSLFGCVFLSLFSYHRAIFTLGMGRRRMTLYCGMMALFFCLPMILHSGDRSFFLSGCLWTATNLCRIDPPKATGKQEA